MKLKAKSNLLERARTAWEAVARQVGETDFSRNPQTGEYLHPGVAMGWRIHKKNLLDLLWKTVREDVRTYSGPRH